MFLLLSDSLRGRTWLEPCWGQRCQKSVVSGRLANNTTDLLPTCYGLFI